MAAMAAILRRRSVASLLSETGREGQTQDVGAQCSEE